MFNEVVRSLVIIRKGVSSDLRNLGRAVVNYPISTYSFAEVNPEAARIYSDRAAESGDPDLQRQYAKAFHERHNLTVGDLAESIRRRMYYIIAKRMPLGLTDKFKDI